MTHDPRFSIVTFLGNSVAAVSFAILVTFLLLWTRSFHGTDTLTLPASGGDAIYITSYQGRFMFGIFEAEDQRPGYWGWRSFRHVGMPDLIRNDDLHFIADLWGWGFACSHLLIAAFASVPVLWWFVVFGHRREYSRRMRLGLCLECGYDVRHASGRCPECGTPCGAALALSPQ